ncbi:methylated-DNA--[protein]-cysteine S-methyltransferase [Candidatus Aerophobetes bacterium]|nr:methylated-DNA--[protein]-cysteine S-methyltransferase [Candidatus Aerophobetes bacterium]
MPKVLIINKGSLWIGTLAENEQILRVNIALSREDVLKNLSLRDKVSDDSPLLRRLKRDLTAYLEGEKVDFSSYSLQFKELSPLTKKVLNQLKFIPYGQTRSYEWVAQRVGTRGYRAVGRILSKNPFPLILPCHRVIRKNGSIVGPYSSRKIREKLLQIEGYLPLAYSN